MVCALLLLSLAINMICFDTSSGIIEAKFYELEMFGVDRVVAQYLGSLHQELNGHLVKVVQRASLGRQ